MGLRKDKLLLKKIAAKIRALRLEAGITQEQFYNDTNIHIGRVERGQINITIVTLNHICLYFDITLHDFLKD
jgi:transcriptional regulator with XRE-family HTH domain